MIIAICAYACQLKFIAMYAHLTNVIHIYSCLCIRHTNRHNNYICTTQLQLAEAADTVLTGIAPAKYVYCTMWQQTVFFFGFPHAVSLVLYPEIKTTKVAFTALNLSPLQLLFRSIHLNETGGFHRKPCTYIHCISLDSPSLVSLS